MIKSRPVRTMLLILFAPAVCLMIAMMVVMRPLTAYSDGFHGPEDMWYDLVRWARTGDLQFPSWRRAARNHIPHHRRAS